MTLCPAHRFSRPHGIKSALLLASVQSSVIVPGLPFGFRTSFVNKPRALSGRQGQMMSPLPPADGDAYFGKFLIKKDCIFYESFAKSRAFVNLRPILPGHVLIMPDRIVPLMADLHEDEYVDLWQTVRHVQRMLKQKYSCDSFNVAVQDGAAAGQSVPHVHVHVLPRQAGDYERNDDIYGDIEEWTLQDNGIQQKPKMQVAKDSDRRDRTPQEMAQEAAEYRIIASTPIRASK